VGKDFSSNTISLVLRRLHHCANICSSGLVLLFFSLTPKRERSADSLSADRQVPSEVGVLRLGSLFASRIVEHSWRMVDVAVQQSQFNLFGLLVVEGSLRARKN